MPAVSDRDAPSRPRRRACYVESLVAYRRDRDRIPGVQVAMLHDGDVVMSAAYGLADVESATPMTTAHRFRIASHSKTFTATAVVRLAERGRAAASTIPSARGSTSWPARRSPG